MPTSNIPIWQQPPRCYEKAQIVYFYLTFWVKRWKFPYTFLDSPVSALAVDSFSTSLLFISTAVGLKSISKYVSRIARFFKL